MKRKALGIAIAVAVGVLSTSASAITGFGNNSNKGSLLIYPRIDVTGANDTLITLTNDSGGNVRLKCYYATSDAIPTPYTSTAAGARQYKHKVDFTIDLTHNQPISWWARSGYAVGPSARVAGQVAPPFGYFPDGTTRAAGEMKCWAVTNDGSTELHYNHLFGTASIFDGNLQAWEYTATAFQALGAATLTGSALGSPGALQLNGSEYDACPNILLGNFIPAGAPVFPFVNPRTQITLASCNQDLRQAYTPTITKLTWTFWNQDEQARTGTHWCANSWYEGYFPGDARWLNATFASLGTTAAYFRIETTADTQICGSSAVTSAYVGVIEEDFNGFFMRGTNLVGRGTANGLILYDVSTPDGFSK